MNSSLKSKPSRLNTDLGQWRNYYGQYLVADDQSSSVVNGNTGIGLPGTSSPRAMDLA